MNVLFLSLSNYQTIYNHGLYSDLLRQFIAHEDKVYVISPYERDGDEYERVISEPGVMIVKIKIWDMQKTNIIKKGISMFSIDRIFIKAIKKYFSDVKFHLILYPTPPITLLGAVEYVKKRDCAKTYLLLKDIFPQNAVDIGLMSTKGIKGIFYRYFRNQEKRLYAISDYIGCMSPANVRYVLDHNPELNQQKVEVCPNTIDPINMSCTEEERRELRIKYGIPLDKTVFVYGGNLGKPQDIPYIIECIRACKHIGNSFFLVIGDGTEYGKLEKYIIDEDPKNLKLMRRLPKNDYDKMIGACDVGLIFLDHRFTIPNFPSRLLSYMAANLPVLACTDTNSDVGEIIVNGKFGWWCQSDNVESFISVVSDIISGNNTEKGKNGFEYLERYYPSKIGYSIIEARINGKSIDD